MSDEKKPEVYLAPDAFVLRERRMCVELYYPRSEDRPNEIEVGLCDVRAADSILIRYDFERDGWSILQASAETIDDEGEEQDPDWQEVAFAPAWARNKTSVEVKP